MSKFYKVRLFDGKIVSGKKDYELVDSIIVKKNSTGYFELLTGYKVDVVKVGCIKANEVKVSKVEKLGHYPFIALEDIVQKNLVTSDEIDVYVDGYEISTWKKIYDEMKFLTLAEKTVIKQRTKSLFKSKK